MGNLENLKGRECMIQAATSALKKTLTASVLEARSRQLEQFKGEPLDPYREAKNLEQLFHCFDKNSQITVQPITSTQELINLLNSHIHVFVGFSAGPDTPPHIAHIEKRVNGGFTSKQQFTSDEMLGIQLMEQSKIFVYIAD